MKILSMIIVSASFLLLAGTVSASTLPASTWQVYNGTTGVLVVHETASRYSPVVFTGYAEDYDGFATSPVAPTTAYAEKQTDMARVRELNGFGLEERAQELLDKWAR